MKSIITGWIEMNFPDNNATVIEAWIVEAKEEYSEMLKEKDITEDAEEEFDYLDDNARLELLVTLTHEAKDYGTSCLDKWFLYKNQIILYL
eukprot:15220906-Ditylum_brightwellii.AAC.1